MKHLTLFENFLTQRQRVYQRKKEAFDALSDKDKKRMYDANTIARMLKRKYPLEKFKVAKLYDGTITKDENTLGVFLSEKSKMLNAWNRDSYDREDGLDKEFATFLKSKKLKWYWHSAPKTSWYDGIMIYPDDYEGLALYYKTSKEPVVKIGEKNHDEIKNIIKAFKEFGNLDLYEPDDGFEVNQKGDRYKFNTEIHNMTVRIEIVEGRWFRKDENETIKDKIFQKLNKIEQSFSRHLDVIKEVYDYCKNISDGPLWTMCGGGAQLQQFYGDDNGYLATLYLDMEDKSLNDKPGMRNDQTLVVNGSYNDPKFVNFKSKLGTKFRSHKSVFGDN